MKAVRFVIPKTSGTSFRVQDDRSAYFYDSIHYHPECQLTYIQKGEGTCFIGNAVERFKAGDVFLIGQNVPHVFRSDAKYYQEDNKLESYSTSIYLNEDTFGRQLFDLPELYAVKKLLESAAQGITFSLSDAQFVGQMILKAKELTEFSRFHYILGLFNTMAEIHDVQVLSTVPFKQPSSENDNERINLVFKYLTTHYDREISLQEIANVASMTTNSFCRYFKKRTGKSFSNFLNGLRIEYACHQIANSKDGFANISMDCGFNSLSYFNRQFKTITGLTPNAYRAKYGIAE